MTRSGKCRDYEDSQGETNIVPLKETIKKRPDISDRLMSGDKSDCTGGVYRARTYDLHDVKAPSRWSGALQIPLIKDDNNIIVCRFKRVKSKVILKRLRGCVGVFCFGTVCELLYSHIVWRNSIEKRSGGYFFNT